MSVRPPRLARWLIGVATTPDDRPWLVADLDELYAAKATGQGTTSARAWYWWQVARSIPHLVGARVRPARRGNPASGEATMAPTHLRAPEVLAVVRYHLRHAVRRLAREPAFTLAAVLTLALGIGLNVAVFAVVEAVLLRPLPYPAADRLVILDHRDQRTGITKEFIAIGDFVDIVARQASFDVLGAYGLSAPVTVLGSGNSGESYRATALLANADALTALGFRPALGRGLDRADSRENGPAVAVLGYQHWQDKFASDPHVVGKSLRLGARAATIVGVAPRGFRFRTAEPPDLILPLELPAQAPTHRQSDWTFMIGRLKPGVTLAGATADLAKISDQLAQEYPRSNEASTYYAVPLHDALVGNAKPAMLLLLGAVVVVLLIACTNVANLLLARSLARRREMAVRMALGAGRARLAAQLIAESLVLAVIAAGAGTAAAHWGARTLVALVPQSVHSAGLTDVQIDGRVVAFALGLAVITTLGFGIGAMLMVRLDSAASALADSGRLTASARMRRVASGLVMAEVALAIVLLVGAGLITRTFASLLSTNPGFRYDHVMTLTIELPPGRYRDSAATSAREGYYRAAFDALRAVPGVQAVGAAEVVPLTGNNWTVPFERPEQPVAAGERPPDVGWQQASAGFFRALEIPLVGGRLFDERDGPDGPPVVIVSEALQRRFFNGRSAVGHRVKVGNGTAEIVGVVGDIRRAGLRDDPRPDMYFPFERNPYWSVTLFVRTASDPSRLLPSLQAAVRSVERKTAFVDSRPLADVAAESVRATKLVLWLLGVFAAAALLLAAVGLYGVMSYVVRQRTREIGVRIALGATTGDIVWLVMRQGATIAVCGSVIGLAAGLGATRSLRSLLYGVTPSDPITMAGATIVLVSAILGACYLPARRAAGVDPARTLADQ